MVLQCSNLYITKTLGFGMPLQPGPLSTRHCREHFWDPPERDSPLYPGSDPFCIRQAAHGSWETTPWLPFLEAL